jgi:hypothetical protein
MSHSVGFDGLATVVRRNRRLKVNYHRQTTFRQAVHGPTVDAAPGGLCARTAAKLPSSLFWQCLQRFVSSAVIAERCDRLLLRILPQASEIVACEAAPLRRPRPALLPRVAAVDTRTSGPGRGNRDGRGPKLRSNPKPMMSKLPMKAKMAIPVRPPTSRVRRRPLLHLARRNETSGSDAAISPS